MATRSMKNRELQDMTITAVLAAIVLLMGFTPLGYIPVGVLKITLLAIPVAVGAMAVGPSAGLFLGTLFGITSLFQAFLGDALGVIMLSLNPFLTGVVLIVPRALMGWLTGVLFRLYSKFDKKKIVSLMAGAVTAPLLNTILFISSFLLFYLVYRESPDFAELNVKAILMWAITLNALLELFASLVLSSGIARALSQFIPGRNTRKVEVNEIVENADSNKEDNHQ